MRPLARPNFEAFVALSSLVSHPQVACFFLRGLLSAEQFGRDLRRALGFASGAAKKLSKAATCDPCAHIAPKPETPQTAKKRRSAGFKRVSPARLERATYGFEVRRLMSNQDMMGPMLSF